MFKFLAKSVDRVLSNTHLCQFFTVFPHFGGGSAGGGGGTAEKKYPETHPLSVWTCVEIFSQIRSQGFESIGFTHTDRFCALYIRYLELNYSPDHLLLTLPLQILL